MKPNRISLQGVPPRDVPAFAVAANLAAANASPSEWYMYTYLTGLAHEQEANPLVCTASTLRFGTDDVPPIKMRVNTINVSLEGLERLKLIAIGRRKVGISVELTITIL